MAYEKSLLTYAIKYVIIDKSREEASRAVVRFENEAFHSRDYNVYSDVHQE